MPSSLLVTHIKVTSWSIVYDYYMSQLRLVIAFMPYIYANFAVSVLAETTTRAYMRETPWFAAD